MTEKESASAESALGFVMGPIEIMIVEVLAMV